MRHPRSVSIAVAFLFLVPLSVVALEKTERPLRSLDTNDGWSSGASCTVSYYNTCTGWIWTWQGWQDTELIGMLLDPCCGTGANETLVATNVYVWTGVPTGYGATGTIAIQSVDANGCPSGVLASQTMLPASGNNIHLWGLPVTGPQMVTYLNRQVGFHCDPPGTAGFASDHPAAGPTGPQACGTCFPTTRATHSFLFGTDTTAYCPGVPINDGVCNAEWLLWSASYTCSDLTVRPSSWANVKDLYR